jgi:hypothetical protein
MKWNVLFVKIQVKNLSKKIQHALVNINDIIVAG